MSQFISAKQASTPKNGPDIKNTPSRSSGISKTLFTPCRRLGLSRRFKSTPNNKNKDDSPNSSYVSVSGLCIQAKVNLETPTIKNEQSKEKMNTDNKVNIELLPKGNVKLENEISTPTSKNKKSTTKNNTITLKRKTGLKKNDLQESDNTSDQLISNANTRMNIEVPYEEENNLRLENEMSVSESKNKKSMPKNKNKTVKSKKNTKSKNDYLEELDNIGENKQSNSNIKSNVEQKNNMPVKKGTILKEIQTSEIKNKGNEVENKSSFAKRLSMKKTNSQDELTDTEDVLSTPKSSTSSLITEQLIKQSSVTVESINDIDEEDVVSFTRKSTKKHIIYSSDEDDFISSQQMKKENDKSEQQNNENWVERINEVKSKMKQKEEHLAELKRAGIYKKLHNVKELKDLTEIWKKGCQDGLTHLLQKLKEHGEMDMPTLMKNLNIPNTIVYNKETEDFV